jgi:hypothetical protein
MVLAYLLKSERLNRRGLYTLALTPSNNHFGAIADLKAWGLILLHSASDRFREVYVVCRELAEQDAFEELKAVFGDEFDHLDALSQQTLNMVLLAEKFSRAGGLNAKEVSRLLKNRFPDEYRKRGENEFYRAIRHRIERMAPEKKELTPQSAEWISSPWKMLSMKGPSNRPTFKLNRTYQRSLI